MNQARYCAGASDPAYVEFGLEELDGTTKSSCNTAHGMACGCEPIIAWTTRDCCLIVDGRQSNPDVKKEEDITSEQRGSKLVERNLSNKTRVPRALC